LSYCGNLLIENRSGVIVDVDIGHADGRCEREGGILMLERLGKRTKRRTVAADKAYDTKAFVKGCRELGVTPHVTQNSWPGRPSAIDGRTTRHGGYAVSQIVRRIIEPCFGCLKLSGAWRRIRFRGLERVTLEALVAVAALDLLRIANLQAA
jgi:IS5 family transposase